jgi:multidrug efflux system membrane fusion protein
MNMKPSRHWMIAGGTLLALVLVVHWTQEPKAATRPGAGRALPVKAAVAEQGDVDERLTVIGRAEAMATVTLRPRVSAQVLALDFTPGQAVTKGQRLLRLDPSLLDAQLAQAEAVVARDDAQLGKARADLKRYDEMSAKGYVAKIDIDGLKSAVAIAEATLNADRAAARLARTQRSFAEIAAPFDGVVGAALVYPGAAVTANTTDLVVLNQVDPIRVSFSLPEGRLAELRHEATMRTVAVDALLSDNADQKLAGQLEFIDNAVDTGTGTIVLKARYANPGARITPGQFVNVSVPIRRLPAAVTVPVIALQNAATGPFVFVIGADGTVSQRGVAPGPVIGERLVLEHGLSAGEKVVTEGQLSLTPGASVTIVDDSAAVHGPVGTTTESRAP